MSLWSPTFCLGYGKHNPNKLIVRALMAYNGPVPPLSIERPLQLLLKIISARIGSYFRDYFVQKRFGKSGGQLIISPHYMKAFLVSLSSRELAQRSQSAMKGFMHHFDFMDPQKNFLEYGSATAPRYNLSNIRLRSITIWLGNTDSVVSELDISAMFRDFSGKSTRSRTADIGRLYKLIR